MRTIIVDDESKARNSLRILLEEYDPRIEIIGEADSVDSAVEIIEELAPDIVFLDIEMQNGSGFDVLEALEKIDFHIVFVTAFEQYALDSFRYAAVDYLLKPVRTKDLAVCLMRAEYWTKSQFRNGEEFRQARRRIDAETSKGKVVLISELDGFSIVRRDEIVYCEAAKNYTIFFFIDGRRIVASRSIGEYESLLSLHGFLRIHKSFIVNLSKVLKYIKGRGGEVEMANGSILAVARDRKQELMEYYIERFGSL